jgi:RNA polymerase sigma factor (sigma-70 family)
MTDHQLLRSFARERSDTAFAELVARHLPLVYSAALRQTCGDSHAAKDVAQLVFTDLARKASGLSENVILAGWLHRATIFASRQILRGERRRQLREQEAAAMNTIEPQPEPENAGWPQIHLLLDEALDHLNKTDRDALLLRFFQQQSFAEVGTSLGGTEEAARKRVTRALEKLRVILQRRSVTTTAAALSATISANAVQPAPAGLAAVIAHSSFAAAGTGTTFTLLKIMTATQLKFGLGALVAAGVATTFVIQHQAQTRLRDENQSLEQQIVQLQNSSADLSNQIADLNASKNMSDEQFNDLLRLRNEVGMLRQRTNELWKAQSQFKYSPPQDQSSQSNSPAQQQRQIVIARLNNARNLAMGFIMYAGDNQGQFPTNFGQIDTYTNQYPNNGTNGFEIVYQGSRNQITNLGDVIVVQESEPWPTYDGRWGKIYGFADGHAEFHAEANSDFSNFEQQHSISPPSQ